MLRIARRIQRMIQRRADHLVKALGLGNLRQLRNARIVCHFKAFAHQIDLHENPPFYIMKSGFICHYSIMLLSKNQCFLE